MNDAKKPLERDIALGESNPEIRENLTRAMA
jgi:hypothetical protein